MDREKIFRKIDIDKIVAEKSGLPLEVVIANTDFMVKRLKELMYSDEYTIQLSTKLGYMYCNLASMRAKIFRYTSSVKTKEKLKELDRISKKCDSLLKTPQDEAFNKKYRKYSRRRFMNNYFNLGKNKVELEKFQNEEYNEHKRRSKSNI